MRLKKFIFERKFLLLNIIFSIYVATNLIGGERGLIAYFNKKNIEDLKDIKKRELIKTLNDIEKNKVLISVTQDKDFLDILMKKLRFGKRMN